MMSSGKQLRRVQKPPVSLLMMLRVTPRYVVGFAAARELSIVRKIAFGSLKNKLLFLLPTALALSLLAPWAIMPLLMMGGTYLCYEGVEKVYEAVWSGGAQTHESTFGTTVINAEALEDEKVASAIKTDFILSAEIMAITLAAVPTNGFLNQAVVLAVVAIGITAVVYGGVAIIVKADDIGVALARSSSSSLIRRVARERSAVDLCWVCRCSSMSSALSARLQ